MNPEDVKTIFGRRLHGGKTDRSAEYPLGPIHVELFIIYVRLSKIIWYSRWCAA
jgi:hypothetical protein